MRDVAEQTRRGDGDLRPDQRLQVVLLGHLDDRAVTNQGPQLDEAGDHADFDDLSLWTYDPAPTADRTAPTDADADDPGVLGRVGSLEVSGT